MHLLNYIYAVVRKHDMKIRVYKENPPSLPPEIAPVVETLIRNDGCFVRFYYRGRMGGGGGEAIHILTSVRLL